MDNILEKLRSAQEAFTEENTLESCEKLLLAANKALQGGCYVAFRIDHDWFDIYAKKDEAAFEDALENWAIQGLRQAISIGSGYKTFRKANRVSAFLKSCVTDDGVIDVNRILNMVCLDESTRYFRWENEDRDWEYSSD